MSIQNVKEEHDSCYDYSTDDEVENFALTIDELKDDEVEKLTFSTDGLKDDASCSVNDSTSQSDDEDSKDFVLEFDERYNDPQGKIAFCCQNCKCPESKVRMQIRNNCGNSSGQGGGNTQLYHKGCCHNDKHQTVDYLSPMMRAIDEAISDGNKKKRPKVLNQMTKSDIAKQYERAKKEEKQYENEEYDVDKTNQIHTNLAYNDSCKAFIKRDKIKGRGLRVLALFSGIGSETVVLKRLGLPIEAIVHIEHDPVAVHVIKWNHKHDGIKHTYIEKFEDIYGDDSDPNVNKLDELVSQHGVFDLVTSGAPCQNLSGLNACRDVDALNAQYLMKVGKLIKRLDLLQRNNGMEERILFLSENVVFHEYEQFDVHYSDFSPEGLSPMRVDAKDFGPVKRNRLYWMNMPVNSFEDIKDVASEVSADVCLDSGWRCIVDLLREDVVVYKANAFLASLTRIDDKRMQGKYDYSDDAASRDDYIIGTYSVAERERMMGLPVGYVEKPLRDLFEQLSENAFKLPEINTEGKTYRDFLPRSLWHFRKKCNFKFEPSNHEPFFQLGISSPLEGKKDLAFFKEVEYCKHLVGNGWSIPVVEHLVSKLRDLFDEGSFVTYEEYNYQFPWAPYNTR